MTGTGKQGKFHVTKEALRAAIAIAIPEATVTGNWRETIGEMVSNLPFIAVVMEPETIADVYDRNIGGGTEGSVVTDHFTIHVFHSNCNDIGCERGHYAQDVATRIVDYVLPQPSIMGFDIDDVGVRETEELQRGPQKISHVIVTGAIHILRID